MDTISVACVFCTPEFFIVLELGLANRKILEELQLKKQMLLKQGAAPITATPLSIPSVPGNVSRPI